MRGRGEKNCGDSRHQMDVGLGRVLGERGKKRKRGRPEGPLEGKKRRTAWRRPERGGKGGKTGQFQSPLLKEKKGKESAR